MLPIFAALLLCCCADSAPPAPRTSLDPLGLGMDTPEYLMWVLSLPVGPPLHYEPPTKDRSTKDHAP